MNTDTHRTTPRASAHIACGRVVAILLLAAGLDARAAETAGIPPLGPRGPQLQRSPELAVSPWIADRGDGTYKNPVLFADYSDPDAIRVGDDYFLVSSSFHCVPGLPILHSKDLVNWKIINHVFAAQPPVEHFSRPRHGEGVWAPSIRHHDGRFWVYYPDPDFGIQLSTSTNPVGAWSAPVMVKAGRGLIDPCPFWDDDGQLYLVHGWAKSRAGIGNCLTLHKLSADGTRVINEGEVIIDANRIPDWRTLEGPKMYKRDGWYYVFAPAGGVPQGFQAVFRSKNIRGPYEYRIVLDQGKTAINGPHQGAWVDTPSGEHWFLHFQDRGAFGRVMHLQPMTWRPDGWPVMGDDSDVDGKGEPVLTHKKPDVGRASPVSVPQGTDEFNDRRMGLQWQWNANPQAAWASLTARPGFLRLAAVPVPKTRNDGTSAAGSLYDAPNFLMQKFPAPAFTATTRLEFVPASDGEMAGLAVFGYDYAVLGVHRAGTGFRLALRVNQKANLPGRQELETAHVELEGGAVVLRVSVDAEAQCRFFYSVDSQNFKPIGEPFKASKDRWTGAKVGLIAAAPESATQTGHADFDWFRISRPGF